MFKVLNLLSLHKNQVTIFIVIIFLEGVPFQTFTVKLSRNTVSFFPFTQYLALLLIISKMHYTVSCSKV